ncbi:MAG TPA: Crp/Fnr family transcriptional regulator, partial [Solirubrobacteraceae bacterium]|nr:Crp/Fnr family transcriptional regulator [Solirubrobacteraceae bacterium]
MAATTPIDRTARPAPAGEPRGFLSILDADPDLADGIPAADHPLARRALARPVHPVGEDGVDAAALLSGEGAFGLLVVEGAVVRELDLAGRVCTELLGPGDVLGGVPEDALLPVPVAWKALQPAGAIVLDARFTSAAQRWPALAVNLHRRLLEQAHRSAVHAAIAQLPRVERRVLALMWQLSERWGRVTPFGVEVDLPLTHEAVGRLVGAQRPTVSLALADLAREGALTRTVRRTWLLAADSHGLVRP